MCSVKTDGKNDGISFLFSFVFVLTLYLELVLRYFKEVIFIALCLNFAFIINFTLIFNFIKNIFTKIRYVLVIKE